MSGLPTHAAARLKPWFTGPDPITPVPGVDGFYGMVPIGEPLSAGAPPVGPSLIDGLTRSIDRRAAVSRSNHLATHLLDTVPRPRVTVRWHAKSKAVRDQVMDFLRSTCRGGELAFDVEPDGPGTGAVKLRATADPRDSLEARGAYVIEVETEEVW